MSVGMKAPRTVLMLFYFLVLAIQHLILGQRTIILIRYHETLKKNHYIFSTYYFDQKEDGVLSSVTELNSVEKIEEVARMLSGSTVTAEALSAAKKAY